jgi:hypothetical protein
MPCVQSILRPVLAALAFAAAPALYAAELAAPTGEVLLTVSGDITVTNAGDTAVFDLAMLQEIGGERIETTTIWTDGTQEFTGVSLKVLLDLLEIEAGTLSATAINDYAVEIPVSDAVDNGPIVAYLRNGEEMSVRDKGPLWVVYPYDANSDYNTETIYSRSIWQLDRIVVSQ